MTILTGQYSWKLENWMCFSPKTKNWDVKSGEFQFLLKATTNRYGYQNVTKYAPWVFKHCFSSDILVHGAPTNFCQGFDFFSITLSFELMCHQCVSFTTEYTAKLSQLVFSHTVQPKALHTMFFYFLSSSLQCAYSFWWTLYFIIRHFNLHFHKSANPSKLIQLLYVLHVWFSVNTKM